MAWFVLTNGDQLLKQIQEIVMTASQDVVDRITAQLAKATAEIVGEIQKLKDAVAAGQAPDFTALEAAAQTLDDIVPDVAEEPPAEEPTV